MDENKNIESLRKENENLRTELDSFKESKRRKSKIQQWFLKRIGNLILGDDLKKSLQKLLHNYNAKKTIDSENVADVATHVIWRITRIGIFALIIGVLPSLLLLHQNTILTKQNLKFDTQNEKIQDQSFLIEAQRRSNLQFEISEILNRLDEELKKDSLRKVSSSLKSRIIAATVSMKPYKSLDKKGKIENNSYSYERGQLFAALINSQIFKDDLQSILDQSNFSNMFLENIQLRLDAPTYFKRYNFINCFFKNVSFENIIFNNMVTFSNCKIDGLRSSYSFIHMAIDNSSVNKLNFICHLNTDYISLKNSSVTNSKIIHRFSPKSHSIFDNSSNSDDQKEQIIRFDIENNCSIQNLYFQSISASMDIRKGDNHLTLENILFNENGKLFLKDNSNPKILDQIRMNNITFYSPWDRMENRFGMKKETISSNEIVKFFPINNFLESNIVGNHVYTNYVKE